MAAENDVPSFVARLVAEGSVTIALDGSLAGFRLMDSRITLAEAEQVRDELERVIQLARTGGKP